MMNQGEKMFGELLQAVREKAPLIHCITNYVTANDCANMLLACGACPVMADAAEEVEEMTAHSDALVLNIGTPNDSVIPAMQTAGLRARLLGKPIVLDPAGAGATVYRTRTARLLMETAHPTVIRGNVSEIKALTGAANKTRGVDAAEQIAEENAAALTKMTARAAGSIIVMTGAIDCIADPGTAYINRAGHPLMRQVTGTGCMLSALTAAFLAARPESPLAAAAAAAALMGRCGEQAARRMSPQDGSASFRNYLIDAAYRMTPDELEQQEKELIKS